MLGGLGGSEIQLPYRCIRRTKLESRKWQIEKTYNPGLKTEGISWKSLFHRSANVRSASLLIYLKRTLFHQHSHRNEVLIQATTWMNFQNVMLSIRSQTQNATYFMIQYMQCQEQANPLETEEGVSGCQS